jgi:hypothetical protein
MREDTVTGFEAELFTNVSMPIRVEEHAARTDDRQGGDIPTLDVSLLTFKPKFDVFEEQWYVDVALEHEREAEPFVRLGLVRFQPHAPRHLQVSYPVIQWTQLLPCRTVEVRRSKTDVAIRVEGLATSPRMSVLKQSIPAETKERLPVTKMIARIVRESHLQLGVPARSVVSERIFGEDEISYSDAGDQVYRAVWERKMPLNITKDKSAKYFVIIEERDARLPATYASEPVSPQRALGKNCDDQFDDSLLLESGHRFIAKIEV